MTLVLDDNDIVKYYVGITEPDVQEAYFDNDGVRKVIIGHLLYGQRELGQARCKGKNVEGCWDPIFVIKPRNQSRYKNLVDLLDELAITEAPKYAIDKFTAQDSLLLTGELTAEEP
ncbi:MAG: hypothetical protein R3B93_04745 [Bacteroidia bacterium]